MNILKKINLKDNTKKLNKIDWVIMGVMVLIYGILSFIRLGDMKAPNSYKTFTEENESVVVKLEKKTYVDKMRYYVGDGLGNINIYSSSNGEDYTLVDTIDIGGVFYWSDLSISREIQYIKFELSSPTVVIGEVAFYDTMHNRIAVEAEKNNPLIDETDVVPDEISFMNSTYFDEIYYARSAYEYANGIDAYEWSHPPLGKLLITIPVAIFGFNPFTYRLMGNIFGILLIPLMYILGKRLFKCRKWAMLSGLLMMFDTFHFAHTRICLVDGFQVFFIVLSVLFMKEYLDLKKDSPFKRKAIYLLLSGTFIGCAIATKWNAAYAALALATVYFIHLLKQYNFNLIKFWKKNVTVNRIIKYVTFLVIIPFILYYIIFMIIGKNVANISLYVYYFVAIIFIATMLMSYIVKDKYLTKLFVVCIIAFIIIPLIIYVLSYILFPHLSYYDGTLKGIIDTNKMMYDYHANLDATHPFSSVWYEWPIMAKPVWFYSGSTLSGLRMTITDIGNPAIWWVGIFAFVYLIINSIKNKDKNSIFILIFILLTFVPYVFIGRLMFMYHYFITIPFVMLGIVAFIKWITEKLKNDKVYYGYIALVIFTFIIFYPIVSATPISSEYIDSLKWLSGWYF